MRHSVAAALSLCFVATALAQQAAPVLQPAGGTYELASGFVPDPAVFTVEATGMVEAGGLPLTDPTGTACVGFVNPGTPDANIEYGGGALFRIGIRNAGDATLIVMLPDGSVRCADDTFGLNPAVSINDAPAGTYMIWAGKIDPAMDYVGEVVISELVDDTPFAQTTASGANVSPRAEPDAFEQMFGPAQ